jgi:hypothetical protein
LLPIVRPGNKGNALELNISFLREEWKMLFTELELQNLSCATGRMEKRIPLRWKLTLQVEEPA